MSSKPNSIVWAIVPAAGASARTGLGTSKVLTKIGNRSLLEITLDTLFSSRFISHAVVAVRPEMEEELREVSQNSNVTFINGGTTRQASVKNAVDWIEQNSTKPDYVVVHDAARCALSLQLLDSCIETAFEKKAVTAAIPVVDTVSRVSDAGLLLETIERQGLVFIQTPQVFTYELLSKAHALPIADATDDASLVSKIAEVHVVSGDRRNIKVTFPEDFEGMVTHIKRS